MRGKRSVRMTTRTIKKTQCNRKSRGSQAQIQAPLKVRQGKKSKKGREKLVGAKGKNRTIRIGNEVAANGSRNWLGA